MLFVNRVRINPRGGVEPFRKIRLHAVAPPPFYIIKRKRFSQACSLSTRRKIQSIHVENSGGHTSREVKPTDFLRGPGGSSSSTLSSIEFTSRSCVRTPLPGSVLTTNSHPFYDRVLGKSIWFFIKIERRMTNIEY